MTGANFYSNRTSNGAGAHTHNNTAITKTTTYRTFEIVMSSTDIKYYLDDVLQSTVTTNLPALNTDIYLTVQEQYNNAASKNFDVAKIYFESNFV
jgi:hypothetical protein